MITALVQKITENRRIGQYRKATHNYEAGIVLKGWEVKAVKQSNVSIEGSYVVVRNKVPLLVGVSIVPTSYACGVPSVEWKRQRRLLLHRREIYRIQHILKQPGLTAIPEALYVRGKFVKVAVLVVKRKDPPVDR